MPRPSAQFHLPSHALGACIMASVERDTRFCRLEPQQRLNFYPATPLVTISWIFEGQLHLMLDPLQASAGENLGPALPPLLFSGPQRQPTASWSPGPVHALMVSFYPEAMARLLGRPVGRWLDQTVPLEQVAPAAVLQACAAVLRQPQHAYAVVEQQFGQLWTQAPQPSPAPLLGDWIRSLATRASHSASGRSLRQWQRRVRTWTGQSQRELQRFVRTEQALLQQLARRGTQEQGLALLAQDAGFADQSHMGREIKRVTGMATGDFNQRLEQDEALWLYRLIAAELAQRG
ncbi:helix-turn-helix domain-containing protein [Pseudoduganella danionis]|uniref:AraC family transcriptional regulator n=1 Tax=Pseudoduganella danionis TaxID=1890295 RepID=UPI0035B06228